MDKTLPTSEVARDYVRRGIFAKGGWKEAADGLRHKTLPFLLGLESSLTLGRIIALLFRFLLLIAIAIYPIVVRKALVAPAPIVGPVQPPALNDGLTTLAIALSDPAPVDYILGAAAVMLTAIPKLFDVFGRRTKVTQHSPYYDLAAAIHSMPSASIGNMKDADRAIQLALSALREEMSQLIGDEARTRVTDVTFLEFCNPQGSSMQVRARTANHEDVKRPVPSERFVAYYVALEGRSFAEHDFLRAANPFPPKRITVVGSPQVDYRSVLYMPVMCSERTTVAVEQGPPTPIVIDSCIGVICVHSAKPYRF